MSDLNEEILDLKRDGKSLREIGAVLQISHEAVRKRLKNLEGKGNVSTIETERKLTASTIENEKLSTSSNAYESRLSKESEVTVNLKTPSHIPAPDVNPPRKRSDKLPECRKGLFQGVLPEVDDLFAAIKEFLESKGIEIYRMQVSQEAYQVKHKTQVIRFYVERKSVESPIGRVS